MLKRKSSVSLLLKLFFVLCLSVNFIQRTAAADFKTSIGTGFNSSVIASHIQPDGNILAVGAFSLLNGATRNKIVRLNASGTEDTIFASNIGSGFDSSITSISTQSYDKILLSGNFSNFNGSVRNQIIRLNASGTEDTAFYNNLGTSFGAVVYKTAIQSDGKIIVGGSFTTFNGNTRNKIARLNPDGTEDTAFYTNLGSGFASSSVVTSVLILSDGRVLVGGFFTAFNGSTHNEIIMLNASGTEDTVFSAGVGSGFNGVIRSLYQQPDGKILIGGDFTSFNGSARGGLIRLNASGIEDSVFASNIGTGFNNYVLSLVVQPDGKILVGGADSFNGNVRNRLTRLNPSGTEDTAFATNIASGFNDVVYSNSLQPDGKMYVGGSFTTFNGRTRNYLVKLNADGTEDVDLIAPVVTINGGASSTVAMGNIYTDAGATANDNLDGNVTSSITSTSTVDTDYSGAYTLTYRASDGSGNVAYATRTVNVLPALQNGFYKRLGTGFSGGGINSIRLSSLSDMYIGGGFSSLNGKTRNHMVKLNASGTENTLFATNLGTGFNLNLGDIAVQNNGKTIIVGLFTALNGNIRNRLVRLNADGTEDTAFYTNLGSGVNDSYVSRIALQSDGKILVGGRFTSFASSTRNRIFRLNTDGTEDTNFYANLGTGFAPSGSGEPNVMRVQTDGKILVGGNFNALNGNTRHNLVRLNSNGTEDTVFYANTPNAIDGYVYDVAIDQAGGVIVGGAFTGSGLHKYLLRLNASGTEDTAFYANLGSSFNDLVIRVVTQPNGKIIVAGNFTTFKGNARNRIVRLNADGTEDTTFATNIGTGFDQNVSDIYLQADGKIIVGGTFSNFNATPRSFIVRLNSDGTEDLDLVAPVITLLGSNPASVTVGSTYADAGVTALDAADGDVTASTTSTSTVNISVIGTYTVVYTARDISGNLSYATRTVNVVAAVSSGGGGGGGGGGYYITQVVAQTNSTSTKATTTGQVNNNLIIKSTTTPIMGRLTKVLSPRVNDEEVRILQRFLNTNGYMIAKSGPGSVGKESMYMGPSTVKALKKFQRDNNILPANGYTGIKTREKINMLLLATSSKIKI